MLGFRFVTINTFNMTVSYSDAKTPTEHTEAVLIGLLTLSGWNSITDGNVLSLIDCFLLEQDAVDFCVSKNKEAMDIRKHYKLYNKEMD